MSALFTGAFFAALLLPQINLRGDRPAAPEVSEPARPAVIYFDAPAGPNATLRR